MAVQAYQTYLKTPIQEESKDKLDTEPVSADNEMIVFEISKQRTRLTLRGNKIECYLLDKKTNQQTLQWPIDKTTANEILKTSNIYVNPSYKPKTGTFSIGKKRNWLYSKNLYPEPDYLKGEIRAILKKISEE
ncbi:MAG TPA: hypothetical protein VFD80_05765 [Flavobacteriaceae bacterium]|nr:hypothetical protein [Flavobacteriaceae bacterium]